MCRLFSVESREPIRLLPPTEIGCPGIGLAGITVNVSSGDKPTSISLNKERVLTKKWLFYFNLRQALVHVVQKSAVVKDLDVSSLELWHALFAYAIDKDVQGQLTPVWHLLEFPSGNIPHIQYLNLLLSRPLVLIALC